MSRYSLSQSNVRCSAENGSVWRMTMVVLAAMFGVNTHLTEATARPGRAADTEARVR